MVMYGGIWDMLNPCDKIRQRNFTLSNATQVSPELYNEDQIRVSWMWEDRPSGDARVYSLARIGTRFHRRANRYAFYDNVPGLEPITLDPDNPICSDDEHDYERDGLRIRPRMRHRR